MYNLTIGLQFNDFRGELFDLLEALEDNFSSHKSVLLRGLPDETSAKVSLSQIGSCVFQALISVATDEGSLSEDFVCGQLESNADSMAKRGILSINLHQWELSITSINAVRLQ